MSDESSQILEMVADGKITVDEAAKLLKALSAQDGDGPRQIRIEKISHGPGRGHEHGPFGGHMMGCHCLVMSGGEDVKVWKEHRQDV